MSSVGPSRVVRQSLADHGYRGLDEKSRRSGCHQQDYDDGCFHHGSRAGRSSVLSEDRDVSFIGHTCVWRVSSPAPIEVLNPLYGAL